MKAPAQRNCAESEALLKRNISKSEEFINLMGTHGTLHLLNKEGENERNTKSVWIGAGIFLVFVILYALI